MKKYKFFIDLDKEERWLNEMARQGYELIYKSMGYQFQPAEPQNTIIKIDYRTFKRKENFEDYRALFEDSGWKHITGTKSSGLQYFKKIGENGSEDIFSDVDSQVSRYHRLSQMWMSLSVSIAVIFSVVVSTGSVKLGAFVNPKSLYYTPGLWLKTGVDFWRAFLFETPFVFVRGLLWISLPAMIVLYIVFALKARKHGQHTQS